MVTLDAETLDTEGYSGLAELQVFSNIDSQLLTLPALHKSLGHCFAHHKTVQRHLVECLCWDLQY